MKDYINSIEPLNARNTIIEERKVKYKTTEKFQSSDLNICLKGSQPQPMSRKFSRKFTHERIIDLHGLTQNEAFESLLNFFIRCQSENVKRVIVITGGNAMKKSVIRSAFPRWVTESFGNYVVSCSQAKTRHGGQGAFYLLLKKC
ncbi:MAG: Smr/MutS family protein [Holosporaceae bacterium]|nr:Smr/MutS family protein [Holosporaceae bacterium]